VVVAVVVVAELGTALTSVGEDGAPERAGVPLDKAERLSEQAAPTSATQVSTSRATHPRTDLSQLVTSPALHLRRVNVLRRDDTPNSVSQSAAEAHRLLKSGDAHEKLLSTLYKGDHLESMQPLSPGCTPANPSLTGTLHVSGWVRRQR
jgi:hypothetical protein